MVRSPNHYDVQPESIGTEVVETMIEDSEFSRFIAGQSDSISPEVRGKIKQTLMDGGIKIDMFLTAVAQKNMPRLAKVMNMLEETDKELCQKWRVKTMDTQQLINLMSELQGEKHRTIKELIEISDKFQEQDLNSKLNNVLAKTKSVDLPKASRKRLLKFFNKNVKDVETDS